MVDSRCFSPVAEDGTCECAGTVLYDSQISLGKSNKRSRECRVFEPNGKRRARCEPALGINDIVGALLR